MKHIHGSIEQKVLVKVLIEKLGQIFSCTDTTLRKHCIIIIDKDKV